MSPTDVRKIVLILNKKRQGCGWRQSPFLSPKTFVTLLVKSFYDTNVKPTIKWSSCMAYLVSWSTKKREEVICRDSSRRESLNYPDSCEWQSSWVLSFGRKLKKMRVPFGEEGGGFYFHHWIQAETESMWEFIFQQRRGWSFRYESQFAQVAMNMTRRIWKG